METPLRLKNRMTLVSQVARVECLRQRETTQHRSTIWLFGNRIILKEARFHAASTAPLAGGRPEGVWAACPMAAA